MSEARTVTSDAGKIAKKNRLRGGNGTEVAQRRYQLYRLANERIKEAYQAGFYIECVAICESIICDRLEARLQFLTRDSTKPVQVLSLGHVIRAIQKSGLEAEHDLLTLYEAVAVWANCRNTVVHQFVKVTDADEAHSGEDRIEIGRKTAKAGMALMRKVSNLVRKHNRPVAKVC